MGNIKYFINKNINDFGDRLFGRKYRLIDKIVNGLDKSDICPDILYLGDSTVLRAAHEDTDRRTTGEMLAGDMSGKANVLEISHGSYHMEIYYHIMKMSEVTRHHPKLFIVPINIRSFSPQWHRQPSWQFKEEIDLLKHYYSGHGLKRYYRRRINMNGYESIPVKYPLSNFKTVGEFEAIRLKNDSIEISESERRKELFIYFYLFQIPATHPRLLKIKDVIDLVGNLGGKLLFYITPINIQAANRTVGSEFNNYFLRNVETVKNLLINEKGIFLSDKDINDHDFTNDSVVCIDHSRSLSGEYFFHTESIDEHLNQKGRGFLSKNNMEAALKMLR
ncbi:MAG: hypothetical protein JXA96_01505 [Sedimentisphaerales bacterium]|nr:hypothetical protein [Sedimentisphaerales bacterium]